MPADCSIAALSISSSLEASHMIVRQEMDLIQRALEFITEVVIRDLSIFKLCDADCFNHAVQDPLFDSVDVCAD